MANIKFRVSKKSTIILLIVLFFVIGGTGGYLLWRVNQQKTVAPTDSEAGAGCCCNYSCKMNYLSWGWCTCGCRSTDDCAEAYDDEFFNFDCSVPCDTPPSVECKQGQDCNDKVHCCWPEVAYCNIQTNKCECKRPPNNCDDQTPQCTPTCPAGYKKCSGSECVGDVVDVKCAHNCASCNNRYYVCEKCVKIQTPKCGDGIKNGNEQCDGEGTACTTPDGHAGKCSSTCTCTADPYCGDGKVNQSTEQCEPSGSICSNGQVCTDCKCPVPAPVVCDGVGKDATIIMKYSSGAAAPKVGGKYIVNRGGVYSYSYIMGDSKGIDRNTVEVKLNNTTLTPSTLTPTTGNPTKLTVGGNITIQTPPFDTNPANNTLTIRWKRVGEATYTSACEIKQPLIENACSGSGKQQWLKLPPAEITQGESVEFGYRTEDSDGVLNSATGIRVLLNGTPVSNITRNPLLGNNSVNVDVSGTIPASSLPVTSPTPEHTGHKLEIIWNDIYGAGGSTCYAYTIITVLQGHPEWSMTKTVEEKCVDDGTENPQSKIGNTIRVTNRGTVSGSIATIVDTLDSKVVGSTISGISNGGTYANGKITWSFNPADTYAPGQTKTFTYEYIVQKDKFGIYDNRVVATVATPEAHTTFNAGARIEARCNVVSPSCGNGTVDIGLGEQCDPPGSACTDVYGNASVCTDLCACPGEAPIPQTGLFDESEKIVIMGGILLFLGLGWTWLTKTYQLVNGKLVERSKERFEQRVVKK